MTSVDGLEFLSSSTLSALAAFVEEIVDRKIAELGLVGNPSPPSRRARSPRQRSRQALIGDDIAAHLAEHPAASMTEIQAAVRRRRATVLAVLEDEARFLEVPPPAGTRPNARCWIVAEVPFPEAGKGRDGQRPGRKRCDRGKGSTAATGGPA